MGGASCVSGALARPRRNMAGVSFSSHAKKGAILKINRTISLVQASLNKRLKGDRHAQKQEKQEVQGQRVFPRFASRTPSWLARDNRIQLFDAALQ